MPDIFSYGDYRQFIRDYYTERKAREKRFSWQAFANLSGFKTKTFLHKVIHGEKSLARKSISQVAGAMGLKKREADYFKALVNFNEGKTVGERENFFRKLQTFKYTNQQVRLKANQFTYFAKWYHIVIRELVTIRDYKEDYRTLAKSVVPRIRPDQAESAVKFLLKNELIEKLPSGLYRQTGMHVTTGDEVTSVAVQRFQKDTMALASDSLDRVPRDERDISTLTVGISAKGYKRIKKDLQRYRKRIIEIVNEDEPADRVYQLNLQFFPVSAIPEKGSGK